MLGWELPPHNSGGLGVACYHMSKALAQEGASIDFVLPYEAEHENVEFMNVHSATKLEPLERYGLGAYESSKCNCKDKYCKHDLKDLRAVQQQYKEFVGQLVQANRPEVIHAHDWLTLEAGMHAKQIAGVPLVVHVHATEFDRSGELYGNPIVHEVEQHGLLMADRIIAVSNMTKNLIIKHYGIPEDKIEVVHNSLDTSSLQPNVYDTSTYAYLESLRSEGYTVITSIGRLTVQKGFHYFVRAAARASEKYDKLLFLIVGDGELRNELLELSADLGIADKVFFTGFVRGQRWRDAYNIADVFVMNSVSEPFGLTALEAAAHDTAVVISRQSGVGEVLHSVFRFDYWDVDRLADELINIAASPALSSELKQNVAREYARISWNDVAQNCMRVYQKMIGATV